MWVGVAFGLGLLGLVLAVVCGFCLAATVWEFVGCCCACLVCELGLWAVWCECVLIVLVPWFYFNCCCLFSGLYVYSSCVSAWCYFCLRVGCLRSVVLA